MKSCWVLGCALASFVLSASVVHAEKTSIEGWSPSFNPSSVNFTGLQNANMNACSGTKIQTGLDQLTKMLGDTLEQYKDLKKPEALRNLKAFDIETPCPPAGDEVAVKDFECSALDSKEEKRAALQRAFDRQAAYGCQMAKMQAIDAELKCLSNEGAALAQQINLIGAQYSSYIQKWNQDFLIGQEVREARAKQGEELSARIAGDPVSGKEGLRAVQQRLEAYVAQGFPDKIDKHQQAYQNLESLQRNFVQLKESRKIEIVSDCVRNRRSANYKCDGKAGPVGFLEYLLCRYKQEAQRTAGSRTNDQSAVAKARAASEEADLRAILEQLLPEASQTGFGDASKNQGLQVNTTNPYQLTESNYSTVIDKVLGKYNRYGIPVSASFKQVMAGCYSGAKAKVAAEENVPGLMLGATRVQIEKQENEFRSGVVADMNVYRNEYSKAMQALTGRHMPPPIEAACTNGTPSEQIGCMKSLRTNLEGLLAGSTGGSLIVQTIRSTSPKVPDVCIGDVDSRGRCLGCAGVNGCLNAMEGRSRHLKNEVDTLDRKLNEFKSTANLQLETHAKQTAAMLSSSSQFIDGRLQKINAILSQLGISAVSIPRVEGEEFKTGPNGIYEAPKSPYDLIGSLTTPPALQLDGNSFGEGLEGMTDKRGEIEAGYANSKGVSTEINQKIASCAAEKSKELKTKLGNPADEWNSADGCTTVKEVCDRASKGHLVDLLVNMNDIMDGATGGTDGSELSGYATCESEALYSREQCKAEYGVGEKADTNSLQKCESRITHCMKIAENIRKADRHYKMNASSVESSTGE